MAVPTSRHAARAALLIEHCYEPDPARQVRALLAILARGPEPTESAAAWLASTADAPHSKTPGSAPLDGRPSSGAERMVSNEQYSKPSP